MCICEYKDTQYTHTYVTTYMHASIYIHITCKALTHNCAHFTCSKPCTAHLPLISNMDTHYKLTYIQAAHIYVDMHTTHILIPTLYTQYYIIHMWTHLAAC